MLCDEIAYADSVYFSNVKKPTTGQVVEETTDTFVIRFSKDTIQRIESDQRPQQAQTAAPQRKVLWQENERYITISFPKEVVSITPSSSTEELDIFHKDTTQETPQESIDISVADTVESGATIEGRVFWDGNPLINCEVRIVLVGGLSPLSELARLTPDDEGEGPSQISWLRTTNSDGVYTFTNVLSGEYDIYWRPEGQTGWVRKLSEYPDILVTPNALLTQKDIEAKVKTIN